jgi:hypothetical protein
MRHDGFGHEEGSADVDVEDGGVVFCGSGGDRAVKQDAGIVDEDVDVGAKGGERRRYDFLGRVDAGEVRLDDCGVAAVV